VPVILALSGLREEDYEFKSSLGNIVSPRHFKKKKKRTIHKGVICIHIQLGKV
jgi:hypothetical protein